MKFKGHEVFLNDEDLHWFDSHNWYVHKCGSKKYLRGYVKGKRRLGLIYLHQLIMGRRDNEIDHINGNGLDNRKSNLRFCTRSQNNANRADLGSKGVHFEKQTQKYRAMIWFNGKKLSLGRFDSFEEAKAKYNQKAKELFGQFAKVS